MCNRQGSCWLRWSFAVVFCLAPLAVCLPAGRAQQAARVYERAFRYPYPVHPLVESLADVQRRERLAGAPAGAPEEEPENPSIDLDERDVRLMPGVKQSSVVVPLSGTLPTGGRWLPPPLAPAPASPLPDLRFDTLGYTRSAVPDDAVAAGPAHIVCAVNSYLQIRTFDGTLIATTSFANFFPTDHTGNLFDPRLAYDAAAGRFLFAAAGKSTSPPASTCVLAVSATSDPTGVWYKYVFDMGRGGSPPKEWADYPCLGYDATAIYLTVNMYAFDQSRFAGNRLLILDRSQALTGQALTGAPVVENLALPSPPFSPGALAGPVVPVEAAEPVAAYPMLTTARPFGLGLYKVTDPLGASGGPSIRVSFIDTTDFESAGAASQAGSGIPLSTLDDRLEKTVLRNGIIWTCHTVSSTGVHGDPPMVNLYKISPQGDGTLQDAKSIVDNVRSYYYPAVVPDAFGDAIVIFTGSDATSFASVYAARYNGATGQIEAPTLVEAGLTPYVFVDSLNRNRWGDYQDASLDVASGTHVWIQGIVPIAPDLWQMRAARVAASPPAPPGGLTAALASGAQVNLAWTDNGVWETGFKIERKTGGGDFSLVASVGGGVTRYSDTGVSPGTSYTYRVRAVNGAGDSAPSAEAGVLIPPQNIGIASMLLAPNPVQGGGAVTAIVTLDGAAPGALTVALSSSNPAVASLAASSLVVPAGALSQSFTLNTTAVTSATAVSITATANGAGKSATLTVKP